MKCSAAVAIAARVTAGSICTRRECNQCMSSVRAVYKQNTSSVCVVAQHCCSQRLQQWLAAACHKQNCQNKQYSRLPQCNGSLVFSCSTL
eukprot:8674-Heterococcus_DN1.PRE.5